MVDRYTKIVLTVIAVALMGLLGRPLLDARAVSAQQVACGTPETPCHVHIVGGPPGGAWQGAPMLVFDAQAESRARTQQTCGTAATPCQTTIVGGPGNLAGWQGVPLVIVDSHRIVPRSGP